MTFKENFVKPVHSMQKSVKRGKLGVVIDCNMACDNCCVYNNTANMLLY